MASDDDYMAFLNKANADPMEGRAAPQSTTTAAQPFRATEQGVEVPKVLSQATQNEFYVSDADEPFVPVALRWEGGLPDEEGFAGLIGHWDPKGAEVEILDPVDWDANGQYRKVVNAVRRAGEGNDVRVYRVVRDGVRVEYWVVTTDKEGGRLVGVKALAVES
ncbi:hypothetical protein B0T25DRAFT_522368 [Lasiosphaeria hispida]|uniref:Uncharacterized protein n=1 Tax=Lasiosphaeria hispida TaxID=260671 RepID=A0AAJ0MA19_9PEZI|nr:hypothetical protein B0T25DRAFT_522368 [Lasiosphaeria hispida]